MSCRLCTDLVDEFCRKTNSIRHFRRGSGVRQAALRMQLLHSPTNWAFLTSRHFSRSVGQVRNSSGGAPSLLRIPFELVKELNRARASLPEARMFWRPTATEASDPQANANSVCASISQKPGKSPVRIRRDDSLTAMSIVQQQGLITGRSLIRDYPPIRTGERNIRMDSQSDIRHSSCELDGAQKRYWPASAHFGQSAGRTGLR